MVGQRNLEGDRTTVVAPRIAHFHSEEEVRRIAVRAQSLRIEVLKMVFKAQSGHLGGAFSAAELVASLYWHHLRIDPTQPAWSERDRFLLSKGHASALLYAALAHRGFFPVAELETFRHLSSRLNGHPDRDLPGVEIVAGPLGHGVAIGAGMALSLRMHVPKPSSLSSPSSHASRARVYVLLGDGELDAGLIWEGAMTAAKYRLGNLVAIVDCNGVQQTGATSDVMPLEPLTDKWQAFGWHVQEIDGHNVAEILNAVDRADEVHARPSVILARTTKGKGVSFMEYDHRWHGGTPDRGQYEQALAELEEGLRAWSN
jgi:transketolase